MEEITYHTEGDYFIPDLFLEKEEYANWKVWSFKIRIFKKS